MTAGTQTWASFEAEARALAAADAAWRWVAAPHRGARATGTGYLAHDAVLVPAEPSPRRYTCHVVYSVSYAVPVLYVSGEELDGAPLDDATVWEDCAPLACLTGAVERAACLTLGPHPHEARAMHHFHPCHTAGMMVVVAACMGPAPAACRFPFLARWLAVYGQGALCLARPGLQLGTWRGVGTTAPS